MVTYKIESSPPDFFSRWKVVAICGNDLQWVVGHYPSVDGAKERIARMKEISKAEELSC